MHIFCFHNFAPLFNVDLIQRVSIFGTELRLLRTHHPIFFRKILSMCVSQGYNLYKHPLPSLCLFFRSKNAHFYSGLKQSTSTYFPLAVLCLRLSAKLCVRGCINDDRTLTRKTKTIKKQHSVTNNGSIKYEIRCQIIYYNLFVLEICSSHVPQLKIQMYIEKYMCV